MNNSDLQKIKERVTKAAYEGHAIAFYPGDIGALIDALEEAKIMANQVLKAHKSDNSFFTENAKAQRSAKQFLEKFNNET